MPRTLIPAPFSESLRQWDTVRRAKLDALERRCTQAGESPTADPIAFDELLRAYVAMLSAHLQGFCRDLYTEAALKVVARIKPQKFRPLAQAQFDAGRALDRGNPNLDNIHKDFRRFGIDNLRTVLGTDAVAAGHKKQLDGLNECRNKCAHGEADVPGLSLAGVCEWRRACDWLAVRLNAIVNDTLKVLFRRVPW